jgi:chromosome segregation protein
MFLKQLQIKGFKSFADTATLTLEPGVTVVVGPNGSGKSNVVDALAWVLGAQAPSAVRSQKMDDVIFAGTTKRPALGRAEVTLQFDNSSGMLPVEFSEVSVTRTLFRTGESEYSINKVPCRLLDIQELLSDSGVGRQQHVIISQGQIDAVLNAKPEDRRSIIEEAAGVLKHRKRKERSERRLDATEANLVRLQDLQREIRRQLRPLEKQAEDARRHGEVVGELHALRVYLAGRELQSLQARMTQQTHDIADLNAREAQVRQQLASLDTTILSAEAELTAAGASDVSDLLMRAEGSVQRARGLAAVVNERRRSTERDRGALLGADVVASMEAEAARLTAELAQVDAAALTLGPQADEVDAAEAALATERAEVEANEATVDTTGAQSSQSMAAEVRGELQAVRRAAQQAEQELARLAQRTVSATERITRAGEQMAAHRAELELLQGREEQLVAEVERVSVESAALAEQVAEVDQKLADALPEAARWSARADALTMALDAAHARAGAERLAGIDGVLGSLLELIDIDEGWEPAIEAALAEALAAVVVSDGVSGRAALEHLVAGDSGGAVLSLDAGDVGGAASATGALSGLAKRVRGTTDSVTALVRSLVNDVQVVDGDWRSALDVVMANPAVTVVTKQGDRLGRSGWRVGAAGSGATGVALAEAVEQASVAAAEVEALKVRQQQLRNQLGTVSTRQRETAKALDGHDRRFQAASESLARAQRDAEQAAATREQQSAGEGELRESAERHQARVGELEAALPELEAAENAEVALRRFQMAARARLNERATAVASLRRDLEVRAAGLEERRDFLHKRLVEANERLDRDRVERARAEERRLELDRALTALDRLTAFVKDRIARLETHLADLHEERRRQSEATRGVATRLDEARRARTSAEQALEQTRERQRRIDLEGAELTLRMEATVEALRRDLDTEPDAAIAAELPDIKADVTPAARARDLERELKLLGPINPLALEEFTALAERATFLDGQLEDVRESRRELSKVIKAIDAEIQTVFAAAYTDVAGHFQVLFDRLFPGGQGRLSLTAPDDLLNTGIEVEAKPSGKNVKKLSLLSGGERSLTALAFLFAVFRSRPSPFYVMDEVEAALDDVNLHRFLGLIEEFRNEAQLIVVSHQKRTMEAADCLFGVTMQPGGSSKVVSEKVR